MATDLDNVKTHSPEDNAMPSSAQGTPKKGKKKGKGEDEDPEFYDGAFKSRKFPDPTLNEAVYEFAHLMGQFITDEPFFAYLLSRIVRVANWDVPTAYVGVTRNKKGLVLGYNPDFIFRVMDTDYRRRSVFLHELCHIICGHLKERKISSPKYRHIANIAMDLAINCFLNKEKVHPGMLYPGREIKGWDKDPDFVKLVESLPVDREMEFYFQTIQQWLQQNGKDPEDENFASLSFDGHDAMEGVELSEEDEQDLDRELRSMLREGILEAQRTKQWGSINSDMIPTLMELAGMGQVDWREHVRNFVKRCISNLKESSMARMNKRAPWLLPGNKRDTLAKILIVVDQSGSMSDEDVVRGFVEVKGASDMMQIDVVNADVELDMNSLRTVEPDQEFIPARTKCGGTDMNCVIRYLNDEVKGKYTGLVIITDGYTPKREPLYDDAKVMWIITPGGSKEAVYDEDVVVELQPDKDSK